MSRLATVMSIMLMSAWLPCHGETVYEASGAIVEDLVIGDFDVVGASSLNVSQGGSLKVYATNMVLLTGNCILRTGSSVALRVGVAPPVPEVSLQPSLIRAQKGVAAPVSLVVSAATDGCAYIAPYAVSVTGGIWNAGVYQAPSEIGYYQLHVMMSGATASVPIRVNDFTEDSRKVYFGQLGPNSTGLSYSPVGSSYSLGRGWIDGPTDAKRFVPDKLIPSATCYMGGYPVLDNDTVTRYHSPTYSDAPPAQLSDPWQWYHLIGRGWISGSPPDFAFEPDTSQGPSGVYYAANEDSGFNGFSLDSTFSTHANYLGVGWIADDGPGKQRFIPDLTQPSAEYAYGEFRMSDSQWLVGLARDTNGRPCVGRGWVSGPFSRPDFIPDEAQPSRFIYHGAYSSPGGSISRFCFSHSFNAATEVQLGHGWISMSAGVFAFTPDVTTPPRMIFQGSMQVDEGFTLHSELSVIYTEGSVSVGTGYIEGETGGLDPNLTFVPSVSN